LKRLTLIWVVVVSLVSSAASSVAAEISRASESEAEQKLPALSLMSPISKISLEALFAEAESAYATKNFQLAEKRFMAILDLDNDNRRAQFRLGNVFQIRGESELAVRFYRGASKAAEYSQVLDEFGEKALLNIALISTEQARLALADLEARLALDTQKSQFKAIKDELGMSDSRISEHLKRRRSVNDSRTLNVIDDSMKTYGQPQLIAGNVSRELVDLPEVTYLKSKPSVQKDRTSKAKTASR
jgi:tetratricopeptide (TPR) repeat protein